MRNRKETAISFFFRQKQRSSLTWTGAPSSSLPGGQLDAFVAPAQRCHTTHARRHTCARAGWKSGRKFSTTDTEMSTGMFPGWQSAGFHTVNCQSPVQTTFTVDTLETSTHRRVLKSLTSTVHFLRFESSALANSPTGLSNFSTRLTRQLSVSFRFQSHHPCSCRTNARTNEKQRRCKSIRAIGPSRWLGLAPPLHQSLTICNTPARAANTLSAIRASRQTGRRAGVPCSSFSSPVHVAGCTAGVYGPNTKSPYAGRLGVPRAHLYTAHCHAIAAAVKRCRSTQTAPFAASGVAIAADTRGEQ